MCSDRACNKFHAFWDPKTPIKHSNSNNRKTYKPPLSPLSQVIQNITNIGMGTASVKLLLKCYSSFLMYLLLYSNAIRFLIYCVFLNNALFETEDTQSNFVGKYIVANHSIF